jgi:HemY protein
MIKLLWRFGLLVLAVLFFTWLADRPGGVTIRWVGYEVELSLVGAVAVGVIAIALIWFALTFIRRIMRTPTATREYLRFRKNRKGYESLSRGIIAAGAGDSVAASKHAAIAGNALADEPLVNVLAAQAAQLKGDRQSVKRIFEEMTKSKETEALGLRGLFAEARAAGDIPSAARHAERAAKLNPRLGWASTAMLQLATIQKDWSRAADILRQQSRQGLLDSAEGKKKQAAMLAARALEQEGTDPSAALDAAQQSHALDPSLVPAALVSARTYAAQSNKRKAAKILRSTWALFPHPDLAEVMAHIVPGEGPEPRFERVRDLVKGSDGSIEAQYALARAAAAAGRWDVARGALKPYVDDRPQARICALMADIEEAQGDKGGAREWLARAINAPRDPMWVSDGVASPRWTPVSPITGEIVTCQWKAPYETTALPEEKPAAAAPQDLQSRMAIEAPKAEASKSPAPIKLPRPPDDPGTEGEPLLRNS